MRLTLQVVACTFFMCVIALAAPITISIESVSGEAVSVIWDLRAIHMVDGSGLLPGGVHSNCYAGNTCWQEDFGGSPAATIVFDLEAAYTLSSMHIWNVFWGNFQSQRGANEVVISTSLDNSDWLNRGTYNFPEAPENESAPYLGFDISDLAWADTRYVMFQINSNYGGGDCGGCTGLSEVQFFGDPAGAGPDVPEPGSVTLVATAGAFLLWLRRRRASRG